MTNANRPLNIYASGIAIIICAGTFFLGGRNAFAESDALSNQELRLELSALDEVVASVSTKLRLRDKPNINGSVVGFVEKDTRLLVVEDGNEDKIDGFSDRWYKVVTQKGETGWAFGAYLEYPPVHLLRTSNGKVIYLRDTWTAYNDHGTYLVWAKIEGPFLGTGLLGWHPQEGFKFFWLPPHPESDYLFFKTSQGYWVMDDKDLILFNPLQEDGKSFLKKIPWRSTGPYFYRGSTPDSFHETVWVTKGVGLLSIDLRSGKIQGHSIVNDYVYKVLPAKDYCWVFHTKELEDAITKPEMYVHRFDWKKNVWQDLTSKWPANGWKKVDELVVFDGHLYSDGHIFMAEDGEAPQDLNFWLGEGWFKMMFSFYQRGYKKGQSFGQETAFKYFSENYPSLEWVYFMGGMEPEKIFLYNGNLLALPDKNGTYSYFGPGPNWNYVLFDDDYGLDLYRCGTNLGVFRKDQMVHISRFPIHCESVSGLNGDIITLEGSYGTDAYIQTNKFAFNLKTLRGKFLSSDKGPP